MPQAEEGASNGVRVFQDPLENLDTMTAYYKSRPFVEKIVWSKCPRPAGLGIPPWDGDQLYVAATDTRVGVLFLKLTKSIDSGRKYLCRIIFGEWQANYGYLKIFLPMEKIICSIAYVLEVTASEEIHQSMIINRGKTIIDIFSKGNSNKEQNPMTLSLFSRCFMTILSSLLIYQVVLILDRHRMKLIGRLSSEELVCPQRVAFSEKKQEVYVTDRWKHCVHVFSSTGDYLRKLCTKGGGDGKLRSPDGIVVTPNGDLVICDTGNNRVGNIS